MQKTIKKKRERVVITAADYAAVEGRVFALSSFGHFNAFVRVVNHTPSRLRVVNLTHTCNTITYEHGDTLSISTFTAGNAESDPVPFTVALEKTPLTDGTARYTLRQAGRPPAHGVMASTFVQHNKIF